MENIDLKCLLEKLEKEKNIISKEKIVNLEQNNSEFYNETFKKLKEYDEIISNLDEEKNNLIMEREKYCDLNREFELFKLDKKDEKKNLKKSGLKEIIICSNCLLTISKNTRINTCEHCESTFHFVCKGEDEIEDENDITHKLCAKLFESAANYMGVNPSEYKRYPIILGSIIKEINNLRNTNLQITLPLPESVSPGFKQEPLGYLLKQSFTYNPIFELTTNIKFTLSEKTNELALKTKELFLNLKKQINNNESDILNLIESFQIVFYNFSNLWIYELKEIEKKISIPVIEIQKKLQIYKIKNSYNSKIDLLKGIFLFCKDINIIEKEINFPNNELFYKIFESNNDNNNIYINELAKKITEKTIKNLIDEIELNINKVVHIYESENLHNLSKNLFEFLTIYSNYYNNNELELYSIILNELKDINFESNNKFLSAIKKKIILIELKKEYTKNNSLNYQETFNKTLDLFRNLTNEQKDFLENSIIIDNSKDSSYANDQIIKTKKYITLLSLIEKDDFDKKQIEKLIYIGIYLQSKIN